MRRLSLLFIKHLCFVCLLITIVSCGKDAYDYGIPDNNLNGDEGLIELNLSADFRVSVKSNESSININDFTIQIFNSSNVKIRSWNKLSEITDPIKLNIGNYKLLAFYGDSLITGFEQPYYMGKSYFTVLGQKTVNINTTCKLSNVGLKINWGDNIKANYNDYKVSVYRQGFKDSLKYSNDEVRVGYLPAGTLKFRIYLTDKSGEKRTVSSSSLDLVAKPNDFISLNLDTKKEEPKEIHANFIIDSSVDLKEHEIIIPGSLKPQNPPTITSETSNTSMVFSELEYYPQSLITQINAPAYIEKCILKINSAYLNNVVGVSNEIDLANLDEQTNQLLINNGLEWGEMFGSKLSFIRFDKLISNIPYNESFNENLFEVEVEDAHGQKGSINFSVTPKAVEINSFNINDNLTRSLYAQATLNTNLSKELIKVEGCLDGVWSNLDFDYASGDGLSKNIKIKSLLSSRTYQIKVSYIHSDKFTTNTQVANTEDAMQLTNGVFNDWSETTINGGNGTYNGKIVCDYVAGWSTLNDKTTYGAKDCWSTLWSGDYGVNWRFCSGTVKTTDITSGTYAAEISTLAFYNKDVNGAWKEESVYNYTRDNGTAYPGLLFLGSVSGETGYYTLGVDHNSRPDSFTFDYKYTPIEGDNCIAYAVVYGNDGVTPIATTENFNSGLQESYTSVTLPFNYSNLTEKASKITVFFQSGTVMDITKMHMVEGSYSPSPFVRHRVVGSVLKIDNVVLNY